MSIASVKEMLRHASANSYAVPAFNVFNYESVRWAVLGAEEEGMPVIIQFYPGFTEHVSMKVIAEAAKDLARHVKVPVGIHLDHAKDFKTAVEGIEAGFPSIMIDGSDLPFEENAALTAEVVRAARIFGVDVEAELGHVGSGNKLDDFANPNRYTDPAEVKRFIEQTGADSLAVAIGNGHGPYMQAPVIDLERISAIKAETAVPLVMHGGSGIPEEQIRASVNRGMSKFNIATDYSRAFDNAHKEFIANNEKYSYYGIAHGTGPKIIDFVREKIRLLNPNGFKL